METKTDVITKTADVLDSRDIQDRIKYLKSEMKEEEETYTGEHEDMKEELGKLQAFKDEIGDNEEWKFGITFINDSYFEDYARDFAEDVGAIQKVGEWPTNHIDWAAASDELKVDYQTVELDGVPFWYR